ncbi:Shikimate kinase 1 [Sinobacterium norvegicum]|uniref:Shikimate kinase n=1 Tax=Sinobacterium norvegicum TaxID=1641715 RepID=A0ABN8EHG4_9GAMM|nr:shikimate kinase AroK [Sinobacterium norvegicum]CAH0991878.1 Shikimate kinase 1 [Sinobacterium norvegicum]
MQLKKVFLVGPMGAGKTTIGRLLAQELNLPFKDSDREIEERTGADIPWIFDVEGEEGFRNRETSALEALSQQSDMVLATGGGIVMRAENRTLLAARGIVVYLATSVEQQVLRTSKDRKRPLLQNEDPAAVLQKLLDIRDPLYRDIADYVVETDNRNPKAVAIDIAALLANK